MQNLSTLNYVFITIVGALLAIFRGFDIGGLAAFLQYSRQFGRNSQSRTYRLSTIRNADVILVLEHGRIIEQGSHQELLNLKGKYYLLNQEQFR